MKRVLWVTLTFLLYCYYTNAQHLDYENHSKWSLGFNVGSTWSTTDVKYDSRGCFSMTLGRTINYDYGRLLSFDVRGRYLGGTWYGQDYDTSDLSNYQGVALKPYKMDADMGFSVNNFQATVHEMSLEFVVHANRFLERTKWDPYVFVGLGATWHKTYGDLIKDTMGDIYSYNAKQLSKTYIDALMDKIYETPLDGTIKNQFRMNIMPSLGFGIGYQVAPRVSIGLEHKSTFTQIDDFDGFVRESKSKQDIYHYTSGFVRIRFKARHLRRSANPTPSVPNSTTTPSNETMNRCDTPVIKLIQPIMSGSRSVNISYTIIASIANVENRQDITFKVNGVPNLNYLFDPQTDRFESRVVLNPGSNTVEWTASNTCDTVTKVIHIVYRPEEDKPKTNPSRNPRNNR